MNKAELVRKVAKKLHTTKGDTRIYLDAFLDEIMESIYNGDRVLLTDFGTFERAEIKERIGTNPVTFEKMPIKKSYLPKFRVGLELRKKIKDK